LSSRASLACVLLCLAPALWAQSAPPRGNRRGVTAHQIPPPAVSSEVRIDDYLRSIREQPSLLLDFLRQLPKGGDLHNHLSGAVYAESYINYAAHDNLCIDRHTFELRASIASADGKTAPTCDAGKNQVPVRRAFSDPDLYREVINAWSMRSFVPGAESGHDHAFAAFPKFDPVANLDHYGEMLAEVVSRAAQQQVQYLELTIGPADAEAARLGNGMGWSGEMAASRQKLLDKNIAKVVADARIGLDQAEAKMRSLLGCGTLNEDPGCHVTVRYIDEVLRGLPRDQVFAEMVAGFEMANADPRFVAVNPVMPEDWYVPMHDFSLHMQMFDYLHRVYPKVRLTLHAGELAPGLVPPEGLRYHIRESIEVGRAERIGHGGDVMHERDPIALLQEMAKKRVLVEICLTSNDLILGIRGAQHPLAMYLKYGVPVALATDDEGVLRSDMTHEYLRAVQEQNLRYSDLKRMARNSLDYSFLPGASLWSDAASFRRAAECAGEDSATSADRVSNRCRAFLNGSERAQAEWRLEGSLARFESRFAQTRAPQ